MKANRVFMSAGIVVVLVIVAALIVPRLLNHNSYNLEKSGSLYENMSDFAIESSQEPDELTKSFLEGIKYEITNIDKENMTATVEVSVPVISDKLSKVLDKVIEENNGKEYDELKKIAESELSSIFKSHQIEYKKTAVIFQIEKIDGSYSLVPTEEWNQALTENLENLYMDYLKSLIGGMTDEMPK